MPNKQRLLELSTTSRLLVEFLKATQDNVYKREIDDFKDWLASELEKL